MIARARICHVVFGIVFLSLPVLLYSPALRAQQTPEQRSRLAYENRLNHVIKNMTTRRDAENAEFNARLNQMNAAAPLELKNFDTTIVTQNVSRILEFLDYLKRERISSDSLARAFEDSLYIFSAELPKDIEAEGLNEIKTDFETDRTAFNNFLDVMTKLYSDVLDVLLHLQHHPYRIAHNQLTFELKADATEYRRLMKIVDADTKDLNAANEKLRQANAQSNRQTKKKDTLDGK